VSQDAVPDLHWNSTEVSPQRVRDTGLGETGVLWSWTRKLCALCAAVFIYPGENSITFVKAHINCAAVTVTDYRVKRNSVACFLASAAMQMTSAYFRDFTQRRMAVSLPTAWDKLLTTVFKGQACQEEFLLEILDL
jgi:hypothetical protein